MSKPACPMCEMTDVLEHPDRWECVTCGHAWPRSVEDAHGNVLADGDRVIRIN